MRVARFALALAGVAGIAAAAHGAERSPGPRPARAPTVWSLSLGVPGAACTAVTRRLDQLEAHFEQRYATRCSQADKGDHLVFTCGERVEAVLFMRELCKDWQQIPLSKTERRLATAFRLCTERSKTSFDRDDGILYCDCAVRAAKGKTTEDELADATAGCLQGLNVKAPPRPEGSKDGPVENALRTACNVGVEVARAVLPARPDADELQAKGYARCPVQLAEWKGRPGGYGAGKDLVGVACGLGIDAIFAGHGLGREMQATPPSDRVVKALEKCVDDVAARGITSDILRDLVELGPAVTTIVTPASFGTCFAVSPDGLLVTARHLVEGKNDVSVRFGGGAWVPARLVKTSTKNDAALLRVDAKPEAYLSFAPTRTASLGLNVFTVGYPAPEILGDDMKFTEGSISSLSGLEGEPSLFQMSVPIQAGNSGGPLVTYTGEVVGIVNSTAGPAFFAERTGSFPQNVNFALKAEHVLPLLPKPEPPAQSAAADRQAAIQRTTKAVCAVRASP
jgi:hypothetical protein